MKKVNRMIGLTRRTFHYMDQELFISITCDTSVYMFITPSNVRMHMPNFLKTSTFYAS